MDDTSDFLIQLMSLKQMFVMCVLGHDTVGKISECQLEGPRFNPQPG